MPKPLPALFLYFKKKFFFSPIGPSIWEDRDEIGTTDLQFIKRFYFSVYRMGAMLKYLLLGGGGGGWEAAVVSNMMGTFLMFLKNKIKSDL